MRITPYNQITETGVTVAMSSQVLEYPYTNLFDTYGTQTVKFTGNTDENFVFYKADYFAFNSIGIVNHNLTSSATITLEANTSDAWGAPPYQVTLTWRDYLLYEFVLSVDLGDTYDYVRLRIQDATNTADISIGNIILGDYIQLPGFASDVSFTDTNYGVSNTTESGQVDGSPKYNGRAFGVNMNEYSNTQRLAIRTLLQTNGDYQPSMCVLWESDFDKEPPLYCRTLGTYTASQTETQLNNFSSTFEIVEAF